MSTRLRLAIAIVLSAAVVASIAILFIGLAETGSGLSSAEDIRDAVIALDSTSWTTNRSGRAAFSEAFGLHPPSSIDVEREGDEGILIIIDGNASMASVMDGMLTGVLNGRIYTIHATQGPSGEWRALTMLTGDHHIVFSPL